MQQPAARRLPLAQSVLALAVVCAVAAYAPNGFALPQLATTSRTSGLQGDAMQHQAQGAHGSLVAVSAGSRAGRSVQTSLPLTGVAAAALAAAGVWQARRKTAPQATAEGTKEAEDKDSKAPALEYAEAAKNPLQAFWKFLRPHTIRGTILGSSAMVARVVIENGKAPDWTLLPTALCGVIALLCGNGFIVGINQIYDVSIDVINKPFLPVAAKELSIPQAWGLILVMAAVGTGIAYHLFGPLIGGLYAFGLFLGTIYSVPPLRLKQSAVAAALIIATVRGFLLNVGVYYATRAMLGVPFSPSYPTAFMTCFCTVYAIVIAVTKDLPDVQGDLENNIETFATRYGVDKVAQAAAAVLGTNYLAAFVWCLYIAKGVFRPQVLLTAHSILLALLIRGVFRLRRANFTMDSLKAFYRLIWALFYSEYFLFPFI